MRVQKQLDDVHKKALILKFILYPSYLSSPNLLILWKIVPLISNLTNYYLGNVYMHHVESAWFGLTPLGNYFTYLIHSLKVGV